MKKSKWPPEKVAWLLGLVDEGLCRREIADRMDLIINAVTTKLFMLGLTVPLNPPVFEAPETAPPADGHLACLAGFPRFEDITRAEAALVRAGTPRSRPFARQPDYSLIGNAAEMCMRF